MNRDRIIYVPGKNLKPAPDEHRPLLWRCLLQGVANVAPLVARQLAADAAIFSLAAWNYAYYQRHVSLRNELPWIEKSLQSQRVSDRDRAEARSWSTWAVKLMYALGDRFHGLIRFIPDARVQAMIADTAAYFDNRNNIACTVREIVKAPVRDAMFNGDRVLLIGHSMGSVIAYDALWELSYLENMHSKVDLFLTLGSPLGMHYVQHHLMGMRRGSARYPLTIRKWKNVSAQGDLVSVDQTVGDDFSPMIDNGDIEQIEDFCREVFNNYRNQDGLNVHRSFGYLINPVVGQIIADWWRNAETDHGLFRNTRSDRRTIPELIAHRGLPAFYPENTLIGYRKALEAGACYLECDVQLTVDRVPVLYHDNTLHRTSGIDGNINEFSLAQLSQFAASQTKRFGDKFGTTPIPTLAQLVDVLVNARPVTLFVELKQGSLDRFGAAVVVDRVVEALAPIVDRAVLISFDRSCLFYARRRHAARIGWVLPAWNNKNRLLAVELAPEFLFCEDKLLPAHKFSIWQGVWRWAVYVVDDPDQGVRIGKLGIDLIETDTITDMFDDRRLQQRRCAPTNALSDRRRS